MILFYTPPYLQLSRSLPPPRRVGSARLAHPVLMCLNAFFASLLIIFKESGKSGEVQMTIGELNTNREAWNDRIFVLMSILVLIAIICAVIL